MVNPNDPNALPPTAVMPLYAQIVGDVQGHGSDRVISYKWEGESGLALVDVGLAHLWSMPGVERRAVGYQFKIGAVVFFVRAYDAARGAFVVERCDELCG